MALASRAVGTLIIGVGMLLAAPNAPIARAQGTTQSIPSGIIDALTQAACDPAQLEAAVKAAVAANPSLAAEIATVAVGQCPADAVGVAAVAASADPTGAAEIVVAVILALPPGQQEIEAPQIVAAVELAVPDSANQITTAITQLAFNPGVGSGGRGNLGPPLVAPHTDVPPSPK